MCQLRLDKLFMSCIAMSVLSAACMFVSALCMCVSWPRIRSLYALYMLLANSACVLQVVGLT
jgi:hypothetical protein